MRFFKKTTDKNDIKKSLELSPFKDIPYEVLVNEILSLLDISSLNSLKLVNKFFLKAANENKIFEKYVRTLLTDSPRLRNNESYRYFLNRFKHILTTMNKLLKEESSEESILKLLWIVTEDGLEKSFSAILTKYPNADVNHQYNNYLSLLPRDFSQSAGERLVHVAVRLNNAKILKYLIQKNADLTARFGEPKDRSPLDVAALTGSYLCMKILLEKLNVSDINSKNPNGGTALDIAAEGGYLKCVKLLIEKGANLGTTPYQLAKKNGHVQCEEYLASEMKKQNISLPTEDSCIIQ